MRRVYVLLLGTLFNLSLLSNICTAEVAKTILPRTATWKYNDTGIDLGSVWRSVGYDDSRWKTGKSPLGFGDDFSETDPNLPIGTIVDFGKPDDKNMTTYFKTSFDVPSPIDAQDLDVYVHVDDGAVVYINGVEAFRRGIDGEQVSYKTPGKFKPKEETFKIPASFIKVGKNEVAAEVHQDDGSSSDLWWEMGITVNGGTTDKPITVTEPRPSVPTPPMDNVKVSKVTVTFNGDTTSAKGFTWYTPISSVNSHVQVVEASETGLSFDKAMTFTGRAFISTNSSSEMVHKAEANGLKPGTTYSYRVGDAYTHSWSEAGKFTTAKKGEPFTFIDLADTQAKSEEEAILSASTLRKALSTVNSAKFIALNGDIVDVGLQEQQWTWLLGHSQDTLMNTTFVPAAGNHEEDRNSFIEHFDLSPAPGSDVTSGAYYSFDYDKTHFVVLNNNEDSKEYADFTLAQIQWMKDDILSAKSKGSEWIIVIMHKGPYTTSNHATDADIKGPNGVRTKFPSIMSELGVDLVFQGHDHIYARTKPIYNGKAVPTELSETTISGRTIDYMVKPVGTVYVIPNTAGPKVYYKNKKIEPSYYDLFEVADEHHAAIYGPDPGDKARPVRSQIQNFIGVTIDGTRLTAVTYEVDQSKNNGTPYIVDQFGIIK